MSRLRRRFDKEVEMSRGRFGKFGGQYVPETLMNELIRLEEQYNFYKNDPAFNAELTKLLNEYAGRPSRLYYAEKMTKDLGGAKIYLKREDLNHTGAHKINNCDLSQERRSQPYRSPQDQQLHRAGASGQKNG